MRPRRPTADLAPAPCRRAIGWACFAAVSGLMLAAPVHAGPTVKRSSWWSEIRRASVPMNPWFGGAGAALADDGPVPCPEGQRALLTEVQITPTAGRRAFAGGAPVSFDTLGVWSATLTAYSSEPRQISVVVRGRGGERATASFPGGIPFDTWSPLGAPRSPAGAIWLRVEPQANAGANPNALAWVEFTAVTTMACGRDDHFKLLESE